MTSTQTRNVGALHVKPARRRILADTTQQAPSAERLLHRASPCPHLLDVDETVAASGLLEAGNTDALAMLDGAKGFTGVQQAVMSAGVEPSIAAWRCSADLLPDHSSHKVRYGERRGQTRALDPEQVD